MRRVVQDSDALLTSLVNLEVEGDDPFMDQISEALSVIQQDFLTINDLDLLLSEDYDAGITIIRSFLRLSKDAFHGLIKSKLPSGVLQGRTTHRKMGIRYLETILTPEMLDIINSHLVRTYSWQDIILARLNAGRGSAIRGQKRGRMLEDFVEEIILPIFGQEFDSRVSFFGRNDQVEAKCDFAIPNKLEPRIIIEVKAYAATGSKQSDVIGDIEKIISSKRSDCYFLFVTDGITWNERKKDFQRIVTYQNEGEIYRIYTTKMRQELAFDLNQMKIEAGI